MTQKKKTALAIASGTLLVLLVGTALAYFGAMDDKPNLIRIGEDEITVTEEFSTPNQEAPFRKLVKIENTGSVPCYIRVRMEFSNSDVQNAAFFSAVNTDSDTPPGEDTYHSAKIGTDPDFYIHNLPTGWIYVREDDPQKPDVTSGYYYYKDPVAPGETTNALLSWVRMDYSDPGTMQAYDLYVYSESVQISDPHTGTPYSGWVDAWHSFAG